MKLFPQIALFYFFILTLFSCRTDPAATKGTTTAATEAVVTSRLRAEPTSLNPLMTYQGIDLQVIHQFFQPMIEYDAYDNTLQPVLAKTLPKATFVKEGDQITATRYDYEIKPDAVWDNGQPVLASDYVFTLKYVMNPKLAGPTGAYRSALAPISQVTVDENDPRKFSVTISPYNFRGEYLSGGSYVVPEYLYDPKGLLKNIDVNELLDGDKAEKLAESVPELQQFATEINTPEFIREKISGSGAYQLGEWTTGERLVAKKKKDWWGDAYATANGHFEAYPRQITYMVIPDAVPVVAMLQNGTLDATYQLPNATFLELKEDPNITKNYNLLTPGNLLISFVGINGNSPKLNDKQVREALAYLLDTDEIIESVKLGMAEKIASLIPKQLPYYDKTLKPYSLNVDKAVALLTDAGWKDTNNNGIVDKVINGKKEELSLNYMISAGSEVSNDIAIIFKNAAIKAGVDINVDAKDRKSILKTVRSGDFELYPSALGADLNFYDFFSYWHTDGSRNLYGFGTSKTDKIIEEIRTTTDDDRRNTLYLEMQQIIAAENPVLFLYQTQDCVAIHKRFENAKTSIKPPVYEENRFKLK